MNKSCQTCGYPFVTNYPEAIVCYECFLAATRVKCTHSYNCTVNKDGNVECPCGAIIYEEMGS